MLTFCLERFLAMRKFGMATEPKIPRRIVPTVSSNFMLDETGGGGSGFPRDPAQ
jgi:hypothetical protein